MRVWGQFAWGLVCRTLGILGSVALFGLVSAEVWDAGVRASGFSRSGLCEGCSLAVLWFLPYHSDDEGVRQIQCWHL